MINFLSISLKSKKHSNVLMFNKRILFCYRNSLPQSHKPDPNSVVSFCFGTFKSNSSWQRTVSKERPGSIVTKTLKNGILILTDTSKELDFYADFKYISFINFSSTHQKLRAWENLPYFRKKGKHPLKVKNLNENHAIKFSVSENST